MDFEDHLNSSTLGYYITPERMKKVEVYDIIDSTNAELKRRLSTCLKYGAELKLRNSISQEDVGKPKFQNLTYSSNGTKPIRKIPQGAEKQAEEFKQEGQPCAENQTVIIANEQTSGRGRLGRSFDSPKNKSLCFSYLFRPTEEIMEKISGLEDKLVWASFTSWTAVAVSEAIELTLGVRPGIKWVNDLYINGKKICGILAELFTQPKTHLINGIIIGIGINVRENYEDFPVDYRERTGSLFTETGINVSRALLSANLIKEMDKMVSAWPEENDRYYKSYVENSLVIGKNVKLYEGGKVEEVKVLGVDEDFALLVIDQNKNKRRIISGEVTLRL